MNKTAGILLLAAGLGFASPSAAEEPANPSLRLFSGESEINIVFTSAPPERLKPLLREWITAAVRAITAYYGRFPVTSVELRLSFFDGTGIRGGKAFGRNGGLIILSVGRFNEKYHFLNDWVITHEMVHLAFPSLYKQYLWMEEGLATYVEPIARARTGGISAKKVWGDTVHDMHQGLPEEGDQGLNFTHTWGRTYWGGALFFMLADLEIRKRSGNKIGLEHALRGVLEKCGPAEADCDLDHALDAGDQATGLPVLRELYDKMKASPAPVDLETLWKELGVSLSGQEVIFDDAAPLAPIRKAITQPLPPSEIPTIRS